MSLQPDAITPGRTALLVIDMQADFGSPHGAMAQRGADIGAAQAALSKAEALVDAARKAQVPVVFVRLLTPPGDPSGLCVEGTAGADFIGPQPQGGEAIFSKTRFSAFARTGLDEHLRGQGIDTLVLAGLTTECCIQSSAWDGFERGFGIVLAEDACAAYEADLHRHAMKALVLSGAIAASSSAISAIWSQAKTKA